MATIAAIAAAPTRHLRLSPSSAFRYLSLYGKATSNNLPKLPTTLAKPILFRTYPFPDFSQEIPRRRCFCSVIAGALHSGEAVETTKQDVVEDRRGEVGGKVGEFRKRLRVVDIKSGPTGGLDKVGQNLVVKGWVRTLRVQSSVTFVEVRVIDCLILFSKSWSFSRKSIRNLTNGNLKWINYLAILNLASISELGFRLLTKLGTSSCKFWLLNCYLV